MTAPRFAGNLLAMPHFADEARYRLEEAVGLGEALAAEIAAAERRIREGVGAKRVAFDLLTAYPGVQILAALAEVTAADRTYVHSALETPRSVREAVDPLIDDVRTRTVLRAGLREAAPALNDVRSAGPRYTVEVDVGLLLEGIGLAVIDGAIDLDTGDWGEFRFEAPESIADVTASLLEQDDPVHQHGGRLIRVAVLTAVMTLVRHNGHHLCGLGDGLDPVQRFADPVDDIRARVDLDRRVFEAPERAPFIEHLIDPLTRWWVARGLGRAEARTISQRLGPYFASALAHLWRFSANSRPELAAYLDAPLSLVGERARDWQAYRARLMRLPHEPVFADTFSLAQVWQPLRASWAEPEGEGPHPDEPATGTHPRRIRPRRSTRVVGRATGIIGRWLAAEDRADALRVVSGGPGAGKSSLAKMIAASRAALGERVLLIELFRFRLAARLEDAINRFARDQGLRHDVLTHPDPTPLLVIFDGLDELSIRGSFGREAVITLLDDVRDLLLAHNQTRLQVKALLLGREVVVQGVAGRFRGTGQVLHLLPYAVADDDRRDYRDPDGLLTEDQRDGWWRAYGACKGRAFEGFPLAGSKAAALTVEPLLNYLVAIAMDGGADLCGDESSLTDVYGALVRKVVDRVHAPDGGRLAGVELVELWAFEEFLRAVAVVAWHGEGRTATLPAIVERCPPTVLEQMGALERDAESAVSRLIAAFYFRQPRVAQVGARTFEFTHQSFAEYLIAREIVSFLEILREEAETHRRHSPRGWTPETQLDEWARLFGPAVIEPNTFHFVLDGLRGLGVGVVKSILEALSELLGRVLVHDFPLSALGTEGYADEVLARSRNAGEALLALASGCAEVADTWVVFEAPTDQAFGTWLRRLQPQRKSGRNSLALMRLARLDLDYARLEFADLYGASLVEASLRKIYLMRANLFGANLSRADLSGANLSGANLSGANLFEVPLFRADLSEANLSGVNLSGANLFRANLFRANLTGANLTGASLTWASLAGANLAGANLSGASLSGASLSGARSSHDTQWPRGFDPIEAGVTQRP